MNEPGTDLVIVTEADIEPARPRDAASRALALQGRVAEHADRPDPDARYTEEMRQLIGEGLSKNTRASYLHYGVQVIKWCGDTGRSHLPMTVATAIGLLLHLERQPGRHNEPLPDGTLPPFRWTAPETVRAYLKPIRRMHRMAVSGYDPQRRPIYGYADPTKHPDFQDALRAYGRRWHEAGHRPDEASDLTPAELMKMVDTLDLSSVAGIRARAMLATHYDAGLRREEGARVQIGDLEWRETAEGGDVLIIHVPLSKTNTSGAKREYVVVRKHPERYASTCPWRAVRELLELYRREGRPHTEGPLFRQIVVGRPRKDGSMSAAYTLPVGISDAVIEDIVQALSVDAGLVDPTAHSRVRRRLVPHSLRAGSATAAAERGSDTPELNAHFRWSPDGTTASRYASRGKRLRINPAARIWFEEGAVKPLPIEVPGERLDG